MIRTLDREFLLKNLPKTKSHDTAKAADVLPFLTNRSKAIRGNFNSVLGEFIRHISGIGIEKGKIEGEQLYFSAHSHELSEYIAEKVDFETDESKFDFIRFIDSYLFNQEEIKPIHPYLFNYLEVEEAYKNEFEKYGQFIYEVFVCEDSDIKAIFNDKSSDDILTELILKSMEGLEGGQRKINPKKKHYQPLLQNFTSIYREDLKFLSGHKDYFLVSFPLLTHYYVFMYVCQLLLKLEQFAEADSNKTRQLYFALEWESISKRRMAVDDLEGFRYIKEKSSNLFPHIHTLSQLSHNGFNEEKEEKPILLYNELLELVKQEGPECEKEFLQQLKLWIKDYSNWADVDVEDHSTNLADAFKVLFQCLKEGTNSDVASKFGDKLEHLGAYQFIKNRGSLGQVLNIKQDFLMLLTAVCVKDKRMPLNDLFAEFEKRGIAFDRYSKKEIITLFSNHNILDKKSDSGDAQYVKPIL